MIYYEKSLDLQFSLLEHLKELESVLTAEVLSDYMATKEAVIERVMSGSASLIHFLVHEASGGKDDIRYYNAPIMTTSSYETSLRACVNSFIPIPPEKEKHWVGLCLADDEVLSARELHEILTEENSNPVLRLTRLMVLCACSSGTTD